MRHCPSEELFKVILPLCSYMNSSASVILIFMCVWIPAACFHTPPDCVQASVSLSMFYISGFVKLGFKTSAASDPTRQKVIPSTRETISAVALKFPVPRMVTCAILNRPNRCCVVSFLSCNTQVFTFTHQKIASNRLLLLLPGLLFCSGT